MRRIVQGVPPDGDWMRARGAYPNAWMSGERWSRYLPQAEEPRKSAEHAAISKVFLGRNPVIHNF